MYELYKENFVFKSVQELNSFVSGILAISEQYIGYLQYIGKIYLPDDTDSYDVAIDVTAELFKNENNTLILFRNYFDSLEQKPENEENFERYLKSYLYAIIQNNLINIFRQYDPVTFKVIRNLKLAVESNGYKTVSLFTDKYIYEGEIDYNKGEYIDRDTLLNALYADKFSPRISLPELLKKVFSILESKNEYLNAVSFCDIVSIYKDILAADYRAEIPKNDYDEKLHYKFLMEDLKNKFYLQIKKYFLKKNISKKEQDCIYNVIDDVMSSYLNGTKHDSIKKLVDRHFIGLNGNHYYNKVEYLINIINKKILIETGYLKNEQ